MSWPTASVLVPVRNDERFVDDALASVAAQNFEDFEVVISDDASTDGSVDVCLSWAKRDSRFRLVRNATKLGMTQNWNRALGEARGRYVTKLDADDVMRPRFLEIAWGELEENPTLYAAFCRTLDCDEWLEPYSSYLGERVFQRRGVDPMKRHVKAGWEWYRLSLEGYQLWHSNALMLAREDLNSLEGWDERWGCASDTDLVLRVLERNRPVLHLPYCAIWYRRRPGSISDTYRLAGWRSVEGAAIHLLSLSRYRRAGGPLDRRLLSSWYRYWRAWKALEEQSRNEPDWIPPGLRSRGIEILKVEWQPPAGVRMLFSLRRALGYLKTVGKRHGRSITATGS